MRALIPGKGFEGEDAGPLEKGGLSLIPLGDGGFLESVPVGET